MGLAAGLAGVGVAQLVAGVVGPAYAPLVATGSAFIDLTPGWLKQAAIAAVGTHDKQVLLTAAGLLLAALCALSGVIARTHPRPAIWLVLGLGAVASAAAATRPSAGASSVLPSIAGAVAGALALSLLIRRRARGSRPDVRRGQDPRDPLSRETDRRDVLVAAGGLAVTGLVTGGIGLLAGRALHAAEASRASVRLPPSAQPDVLPSGVGVGVPGVSPFRIPNGDFYRIDTALLAPQLKASNWHLRVHGMVSREVRLDFEQLLASPLVEHDVTLTCVSNEVGGDLIGNARWLGLPLETVLRQAGPHPDADMVLSTSMDGWTASTPLAVLLDGRTALLAVGMNGEPLPVEHGFPVRMVVPGLYGYVSATKWVVDLEVTRFDRAAAYWTTRGWSAQGPVKTQSRIDVPGDGAMVRAGRVAVAGVAWAQHRGIRAVQVRVDGGPWQQARLAEVPSADTWRQWVFPWDATVGSHHLQVRATDATGLVQTGEEAPPEPNGATGWHTIQVDVQ